MLKLKSKQLEGLTRHPEDDSPNAELIAPPERTRLNLNHGMSFTTFGPYCYRAWAAKHPLAIGPWEAWYEIHTLDQQTMLSGPTKVLGEFSNGEDALAAANMAAKQEILRGDVGGSSP